MTKKRRNKVIKLVTPPRVEPPADVDALLEAFKVEVKDVAVSSMVIHWIEVDQDGRRRPCSWSMKGTTYEQIIALLEIHKQSVMDEWRS